MIVPDDQLSLAIGRDGQNARLAARLTGWKVDITSETEFAQQDQDIEYEGEEALDGRCMAVLTTGRRCPNAGLEGSPYCGLPQHQVLARFDTNQVAVLSPLSDEEVATLANSDADEGEVSAIVERAESQFDEAAAEAEAAEAEAAEKAAAAEAAEAEAAEAEAAEAEEGEESESDQDAEEGEESKSAQEGEEAAEPEEAEDDEEAEEEPAAEADQPEADEESEPEPETESSNGEPEGDAEPTDGEPEPEEAAVKAGDEQASKE